MEVNGFKFDPKHYYALQHAVEDIDTPSNEEEESNMALVDIRPESLKPQTGSVSRKEKIKQIALANGFKLKEQPDGSMDLNPYVYDFAEALLRELNTSE